jgi:hypothetical protein
MVSFELGDMIRGERIAWWPGRLSMEVCDARSSWRGSNARRGLARRPGAERPGTPERRRDGKETGQGGTQQVRSDERGEPGPERA